MNEDDVSREQASIDANEKANAAVSKLKTHFFQEEGFPGWIAHVLPLDLVTAGETLEEAAEMAADAAAIIIVDDIAHGLDPLQRGVDAEVTRLREALEYIRENDAPTWHDEDNDKQVCDECDDKIGPNGNARQYGCRACKLREYIDGVLKKRSDAG